MSIDKTMMEGENKSRATAKRIGEKVERPARTVAIPSAIARVKRRPNLSARYPHTGMKGKQIKGPL